MFGKVERCLLRHIWIWGTLWSSLAVPKPSRTFKMLRKRNINVETYHSEFLRVSIRLLMGYYGWRGFWAGVLVRTTVLRYGHWSFATSECLPPTRESCRSHIMNLTSLGWPLHQATAILCKEDNRKKIDRWFLDCLK